VARAAARAAVGWRVPAAIFAACYVGALAVQRAHGADLGQGHTLLVSLGGALILFLLAGIAPAALFAATGFRRRFAVAAAALWLGLAAVLSVVAAISSL
jgi:hypothetical protein